MGNESKISGQCYCGETRITAKCGPQAVALCHCVDCRRITSAPVAAFAAFAEAEISFAPDEGQDVVVSPGVRRTFCRTCGTTLTGRYDYLPGTVYVGVGLLDQADELEPELHSHDGQRLKWLHIDDTLPRFEGSARSALNDAGK